ncbi:MAG: FTR1 family protein [Azoarcus sp.]|jgi:high-affinity iron transporter|nr:FTR1 family protein [Azoarcus sp.]
MFNSFFVVWRESLEALLIVGILYAWLKVNDDKDGSGKRALVAGIVGGIVLALALGWALLTAQSELAGEALEAFQSGALIVAALLISQMVWWMSRHGQRMKAELEGQIARAQGNKNRLAAQWNIAVISALAIAREGAETVIFLYGIAQKPGAVSELVAGACGGFVFAIGCALVAAHGLAHLRLGTLLRLSSLLLLVLASSLLVAASDRLIGMDWLPALIDPVWDSSALIDHNAGVGRILADFAGYRAQPALTTLLVWGGYWLLVVIVALLGRQRKKPA